MRDGEEVASPAGEKHPVRAPVECLLPAVEVVECLLPAVEVVECLLPAVEVVEDWHRAAEAWTDPFCRSEQRVSTLAVMT
ncbi:hypothetical protein G3I31_34860 [Streptomyces sp. SID9913]|nr:hypothetical protein [Streptomyces sp. SID9913]